MPRFFALIATISIVFISSVTYAQNVNFFRIGTGATSGTYFVIGGLLANAISSPPGARPCERGGSCGVPGLIAVAQSTEGSNENIRLMADGTIESALVQADLTYYAYFSQNIFQKNSPTHHLRAIASLYPDMLHIVVRKDSTIQTIEDLRGKRISMGEAGSGTTATAELLLKEHGLQRHHFRSHNMKLGQASDALSAKEIDALILVGGYPLPALEEMAKRIPLRLLSLTPEKAEEIANTYLFLHKASIPADAYEKIPAATTIAVSALLLINADAPVEKVFNITRSLWHPTTRTLLQNGHPQGQKITLDTALDGIGIPLHPGAEQYYRQINLIPENIPQSYFNNK